MKLLGILMVAALPAIAVAAGDGQSGKTPPPKPAQKKEAPKPPEKKAAPKLEIGKPAPAFELKDLDGKAVKLSDYKGKTVVLEWFNPECPVATYYHTKGPLKDLGARMAKDGIVWLAINSGGSGMEGTGVEKNKKTAADWKIEYPILLDEAGTVGHAYGAKVTPHMFIIDGKGNLVYRGGVDNAPGGKAEGGTAVNYIENALAELKAGKAITKNDTNANGCGVKYGKPKT
jgi:peroxiredoxin